MKMVSQKQLNELARKIIENNQYVCLSTTDGNGNPWISPVAYCYDKKWNIYFVSIPQSKHCQNIRLKKNIAVAVYDSRQAWGEGVGLQIEALAKELGMKQSLSAGTQYIKRKYPYGNPGSKTIFRFLNDLIIKKKVYKFYKITPRTVWMNNPNLKTDARIKVDLNG